jgi:cytochrome c553
MRSMICAEHANKLLRTACYAMLVCTFVFGKGHAATVTVAKSQYETLNCEQLRVEFLRQERGLLLDKSGAKMPGVGTGEAVQQAGAIDRSLVMSDALAAMDLLSGIYVAKRCDPKEVQKSRTLAPAGEISTFVTLADIADGQRDYKNRCAMCHGPEGKGGGWFAQYLTIKPPVLSQLKRNANGMFPMERLYEMIDGRADVAVHGGREMPVWGANYRNEARRNVETYAGEPSHPESNVRARIYGLLKYIYRLQE